MEYRKEPKTGIIYNEETVVSRYIKELPDAGAIISQFMTWEKVTVHYDSRIDTMLHIKRVAQLLTSAAGELIKRANVHDNSKLESPEKEYFDESTPKLASSTYGSDEYKGFLKDLKVGLDHHYANNSHHPEHYPNGINGFDLFDLVELFFDWRAATERHNDGNIYKSIQINKERFKYSDQIAEIFTNTAERLNYEKPILTEAEKNKESGNNTPEKTYTLTESELKELTTICFDKGAESVILKISNENGNSDTYSMKILSDNGDVITPYSKFKDKESLKDNIITTHVKRVIKLK